MKRSIIVLTARLFIALPLALTSLSEKSDAALPVPAALAASADEEAPLEAVASSRLLGAQLPEEAFRLRSTASLAVPNKPLRDVAKSQGALYDPATTEGLLWAGRTHTPERGQAVQDALIATLKKAGCRYEIVGEKDTEEGHLTFFLVAPDKTPAKRATLGLWLARKEVLLLGWGMYSANAPASGKPTGEQSAEAQKKRDAALVAAIEEGTADRVTTLLAQGANPNAKDDSGSPCVQITASRGKMDERSEKLRVLLEAGGDPNKGNGTFLPLHTATLTGRLDVMRLLLDKGADINGWTEAGITPLHSAAIGQNAEAAKLLLKRGADPQKRDNKGRTARELAERMKATAVADALREAEAAKPSEGAPLTETSGADAPQDALLVSVGPTALTVNVMKNAKPTIPVFPKLTPKPGYARGYVYDTKGKPLVGARIGVRSTAAGGFYSGASAKTDARGYYEIAAPWGAAHFYNAGYVIDYGEGRAALGLFPADGEADSFASTSGVVENWVLTPYGVADRDAAQDNPQYANNYYGGDIILGYDVTNESSSGGKALPANAEIELTLTPDGPLLDGSKGRTILIRKNVGTTIFGQLYINNIPVGAYRITARAGGRELRMRETGPYRSKSFGLDPKEATGSANLLLRPSSAKADMVIAGKGNWDQISITLERP